MNTQNTIREIYECIGRMKAVGVKPDTVLMNPVLAQIASVKGNAKQRKRARFWNRKRIAHFKTCGLDVRIVTVPRSMLSSL